jgi:hypothetical protein
MRIVAYVLMPNHWHLVLGAWLHDPRDPVKLKIRDDRRVDVSPATIGGARCSSASASPDFSVRPDGVHRQWRKVPPR